MSSSQAHYNISALESCLLSSLLSVVFVASLYVWALCGYNVTDRNNSTVIKQRIISVTFVCVLAPIIIACYCTILDSDDNVVSNHLLVMGSYEFWKSIGVNFETFSISLFYTLLLMMLLFLGPLVENPYHFHELTTKSYPSNLMIIRGLIIGPICEEWVYRGCIISLLYYGKLSYWLCILIPPALFSVSHAHHIYYQITVNFGIQNKKVACVRVLFQLFYTSIFAMLASIIFVRTGNVFAPMVMHIWCNCMGFPPFTFITQRNGSPTFRDIINGAAYVVGLTLFIVCLQPLTEPEFFGSVYENF